MMIEWIARIMPVLIVVTITACVAYACGQAWLVMSRTAAAWATILGAIGVAGWWVALYLVYGETIRSTVKRMEGKR